MICPKCKCEIDADSYFCDQCGTELLVCPKCNIFFGRGKRCTQCGTELITAKAYHLSQSNPAAQPASQQPAAQPAPQQPAAQPAPQQPAAQPAPQQPAAQPAPKQPAASQADKTLRPGSVSQPAPELQPGHLVCANPRIRLGLASGVIIGRRGHYPSVFGQFPDVSGNHARIDQVGDKWQITDMESTNGTFINGSPMTPNRPYPLRVGDTIRFSTLDFKVEI